MATSACQDAATAAGTALYVTTEFDPLLQLTQLQVSGQVEGGGELPGALLPENPGRILQSGETFRVLLPEAPDGARVTLRLQGRSGAALAAEGTAETQVRAGYEVDVRVALVPWSEVPDSGTPDGGDAGTPDGGDSGTPDAGSFCMNCPDGCCRDGFCVPRTFQSCGVGGVGCTVCDGVRANACSALGTCTCGGNPACGGINVDRCDKGQCKCGGSSPCGPGQACVDGRCRCTPGSCPNGCCSGDTCEPGNEESKCGTGGEACEKCRRECTAERTCR
ncbi:hypothetical protein [Pyxidicoccus trucidator]|uniref:hypothetical protein n=1 Tax=Pyxidicoccus trucidator TaxID=2709662 RepID=UPI001F086AC5|nr:hypothetical protein [Pyxidicoccus trucidator]